MRARFVHTTSRAPDRLPSGQTRGRPRIAALLAAALVAILGLVALIWWLAGAGTDGAVVAGLAVLGPTVVAAVYASVFTGPRGR